MKGEINMKKKFLSITSLVLTFCVLFTVIAGAECKAYSWSIKRNGNKQPHFSAVQREVEKLGGYYLDKNHGDGASEKVLYLTFDAGYENGNIEKILNVLKKKNVTAAFFVLDNLILKNTELVKRMKDDGNLVCNHTKNHKDLSKSSFDEIKKDLTALEKIYEEKTGYTLDKYFRFPEGRYSFSALESVKNLGYKTVFWSFAYDDWDNRRQPSEEKAIKKILSNTHNGAVILLHPTSATNAAILERVIDAWQKEGYRLGTLDELCR